MTLWLREGQIHVAYHDAILSQYAYRYDRRARRLQAVDTPHVFRTAYASPQLEFWELDDEQWRKIARRPYERHGHSDAGDAYQPALLELGRA